MRRKFLGKFPRLNVNSLLSRGLFTLLLLAFVGTVYIITTMVSMYAGFIHGVQNLWDFSPPWWLNLIVFTILAILIVPVSRWLNARVNELVYAQHGDPYILITKINELLQTMVLPQFTLPLLAQTIASVFELPYIVIETAQDEPPIRYTFGQPPARGKLRQLPIVYLDKQIGMLQVSSRAADQSLSESDLTLLQDVAQKVGIALYAAQLAEDLQHARERLVIAREEERRRIRNDLHDGLAPTLSSLQLQLGAVRNLIRQNPEQAEALIGELRDDIRSATTEIRQLVYDLRPPMLDELGLIGAMRNTKFGAAFQDDGVIITVIAPDPMPKLSAAVEVAVYRIASEALHNVIKHAQASTCEIRIEINGGCLILKVINNGERFPVDIQAGVGLHSMKERAAELGGMLTIQPNEPSGTCVYARIPLESGCVEVYT